MDFSKKFISATKDYATFYYNVNDPYIRKSFKLSSVCRNAEILICGLGFYELYINGNKITKGHMAPYVSNPDDIYYFDKYDVAPYLTEGENVIGIMLGNGFQNNFGGAIWDFDRVKWRSAPKVALRFDAVLDDGSSISFEADESFKVSDSPIIFDDYRMGEHYDANLEKDGWNMPGFDDFEWRNAISASAPKGIAKLCEAESIVVTKELKPVKITSYDGGYLYDFGENCAGLCRLKVCGAKGQKIEMIHGERLVDGKLDFSNIIFDRPGYEYYKTYNQKSIYMCKGDGEEIYIPSFTYYGFQYVYVTGITEEQATDELLTYLVMNSGLKEMGSFECSDEIANKLQEMTRRSDLANFYYFPTDCPHREKNGWMGDASMSAEHMLINLSAENSLKEWLYNVCAAQNEKGALPGIVPTGGWGFAWGNGPVWDGALTWIPYYIYRYRGDKSVLQLCADSIYKYLKYIETRRDEKGIINFGLGDWCQPGREPDDPKCPVCFTDSAMVMDISRKASYIFDVLNMSEEKAFADKLYSEMRATVRDNFVDLNTMNVIGNCQSSQAIAIFFDVLDEAEKPAAFEKLLEYIKEEDNHLDVGMLGLRVIFHVLSDFGRADLAYDMITAATWPSYGEWVKKGSTTLWEMFIKDTDEHSPSFNHHFFGDISAWFIKSIAGINLNPCENNVNEVLIAPHFIDKLDYAKAYHTSPAGRIDVSWKRYGDCVFLTVNMPEGMCGKITIPDGYMFESGKTSISAVSGEYKIIRK